jgi:hypothetical protein
LQLGHLLLEVGKTLFSRFGSALFTEIGNPFEIATETKSDCWGERQWYDLFDDATRQRFVGFFSFGFILFFASEAAKHLVIITFEY